MLVAVMLVGGLGVLVSPLQVSGGISTLQSRASGLQSTTQGNSVRTKKTPPSQTKKQTPNTQHYIQVVVVEVVIAKVTFSVLFGSRK